MAKYTLDDPSLDPDEGPPATGAMSEARRAEIDRAKDFLDELSDLLSDPRFNFANETLSGIFDTVERALRVSPGQVTAVRNIREGGARARDERPRGGSRRYEGWSR